jgi:hypothetical protein
MGAPMRFRVEHLRAYEAPGEALGVTWLETGREDEVDAYDELEAAALCLAGDDVEPEAIAHDPGARLYALAGEDEAVRVTPIG